MNLVFFTDNFKKKSVKLRKNNRQLQKKFTKQLELFAKNPLHPSLKKHKLRVKDPGSMPFGLVMI